MADSIWVGCYTSDSKGNGTGVRTFRRSPSGELTPEGELAMPSPSWLAAHPELPVVYAANESSDGTITTISTDLEILGTVSSGGADPCHLTVTPDGRHLLCANYSSGSLAVFALDRGGRIAHQTDLVRHEGGGPVADRQESAHVHSTIVRDRIVSAVDLGTDEIRSYELVDNGKLDPLAVSAMPPGTGPRELLLGAGDLAYVAGELGGTVVVVREGPAGTFTPVTTVASTAEPVHGDNWVAHLELVGDRLFVSNRGADVVTVFDVTGDEPKALRDLPCGEFPRHYAIVGETCYVAAQKGDAIVAFPVDGGPQTRYETGTPTCVLVR